MNQLKEKLLENKNKNLYEKLKWWDFKMREIYITYFIAIEAKLRNIWCSQNNKSDTNNLNISLKSIVNDIVNNLGTYKDKLKKCFPELKHDNPKKEDDLFWAFLNIFRYCRNFLMHGNEFLFGEIFDINGLDFSESKTRDSKSRMEEFLKSKYFTKMSCESQDQKMPQLLLMIIFIISKSTKEYVAKSIIYRMNEQIMKFYFDNHSFWEEEIKKEESKNDKKIRREEAEKLFYKDIGLKADWANNSLYVFK